MILTKSEIVSLFLLKAIQWLLVSLRIKWQVFWWPTRFPMSHPCLALTLSPTRYPAAFVSQDSQMHFTLGLCECFCLSLGWFSPRNEWLTLTSSPYLLRCQWPPNPSLIMLFKITTHSCAAFFQPFTFTYFSS